MGYELTNAEIDRLSAMAYLTIGYDRVREWFAALPVVSREAALGDPGHECPPCDPKTERKVAEWALQDVTKEEWASFSNSQVSIPFINNLLDCRRQMFADAINEPELAGLNPDAAPADDDTDEIRMIRAASQLSTLVHTIKDPALSGKLAVVREYLRRNPKFPRPVVFDEAAAPAGPPVYLVPDPGGDGFRVREKGDGQTDPEVDHVTAAEIVRLVRAGR